MFFDDSEENVASAVEIFGADITMKTQTLLRALVLAVCLCCVGDVTDRYEASNGTFRIRVDRRVEVDLSGEPGAYYEFFSTSPGSDMWNLVTRFRHDDEIDIPRSQIRFLDERSAFFFIGWIYAVTRDGGGTWSLWSAAHDLPGWDCCNYGLIQDVVLSKDGSGTMRMHVMDAGRGEVPELITQDFGRSWVKTADP